MMYSGYRLDFSAEYHEDYYQIGLKQFQTNSSRVERDLLVFATVQDALDGSAIQNNWFPQVKADIFISHSHADNHAAIALSGILLKHFGLTSFIDSCIWGYAGDLLKIIDDDSCLNPGGKTYNYSKRNLSTSHVHMMLASALLMMIDKTECLLFLDTPNSINVSDVIDRTASPWIYSEIAFSRLVRRKPLSAYRPSLVKSQVTKDSLVENFSRIEYQLDTLHLSDISSEDLERWAETDIPEGKNPLDVLYELCPLSS